jgi:cytochrome c-type biogenesis protein CcmH/NrfG
MKNNQFEKGLAIFSECTQRDPNSLEAQYLLGVCAFHLEHYDEAVMHFCSLLKQDPQYRKNAYLFISISYKKKQQNE